MKKRKFYRATLPTIVWDPKSDSPLVVFERGQFTTSDEAVAELLVEKGYPEVALDATVPPPMPNPPIQTGEVVVKVLGSQVTEETMLSKHKRDAMLKSESGGKSKRSRSETKQTTTKKKRTIKRRGKK